MRVHGARQVVLLLVGLTAARPAAAVQPLAVFLRSAHTYSADNSEARANRAQAKAEAEVARGRLLPGIALRGSYVRNQYETAVLFPEPAGPVEITITPQDQFTGSATLNVPLVDLSSFARAAAARAAAQASEAQALATALSTESQVAQDYYQLLADLALVAASRQAVDVARESLRVAEERKAAGTAALLDVDRARAEVESDVQQLAAADLQVSIVARALESLSGVAPAIEGSGELVDDLHPEAPAETFETPDEKIPSVLSAEQSSLSAEEQARGERYTLLPTLSGSITEQATNASGFVGHDAQWQATLGLSWSFDFTTAPGIRSQDAAAEAARARLLRARLAARDAIHNAWSTVATEIERSRSARIQAGVSAEASQQALERYEAGAVSQLDLLQAQRDAFAAQASRIQADANLINARAQLRIASGTSLVDSD